MQRGEVDCDREPRKGIGGGEERLQGRGAAGGAGGGGGAGAVRRDLLRVVL